MKILVIGAGVGGLAVARALTHDGHSVEVFEQSPRLRTSGAAVTLWSNGTGVLDALRVPLDGLGGHIDVIEQRDPRGSQMLAVDVSRSAARYGYPHICVLRSKLIERLAADLPTDTISFNRECIGVSEDADHVQVRFADGTTAEGDVLIGADGRGSAVREYLWGRDPAEYSGWATWQGVGPIPTEITSSRRCVMYVGKPGLCGLMPVGDGMLQWWFDVRWTPRTPTPASPVYSLRKRFVGWPEPVTQVLAAINDKEAGFFPHVRHKVPEIWGRGRVTLLGDAAHSMPPTRAQGANQALEDAWKLAERVRRGYIQPASALRAYERARSPKAGLVARQAGKEDTNAYRPLFTRLVPSTLASRYHEQWLKRVSDFL